MSTTLTSNSTSSFFKVSSLGWILLGLFLVSYGLVAFHGGTKVSPAINHDDQADKTVLHIMQQADQGVPMQDSEEVRLLPIWVNLIAHLKSSGYIYSSDSIMKSEEHYFTMDAQRRYALSTHMMLGIIIMAAGFLQFWPAFRRKYRKAHRVLGVVYVAAAFGSMSMSGYYLINNRIDETYSEFVFYVGLWYLLILSLTSISIAGVAILKRNIAVHLGWQALAFGCFLTAPLQRALWVSLSPLANGASFNEVNIAINVMLIGLACFLGYLLFYFNRESSPLRTTALPAPAPRSGLVKGLIGGAFLIGWGICVVFYIASPGLAGSAFTRALTPESARQFHDAITATPVAWALVAALAVFAVSCARSLVVTAESLQSTKGGLYLTLASGACIAGIYLLWGEKMGMPSHDHSLAGAFYTVLACLVFFFLALIAYAVSTQQFEKAQEWLRFAAMLAFGPAQLYLLMFIMDATHFVPLKYALMGHGYQAAAASAVATSIIAGHLWALYSPLTQRYAVN